MSNLPALPLAGIRVVEVAENLAGPYAAQILADLGAHVVKVERPLPGDPARQWGPPFMGDVSPLFAFANRGKRTIALDLRDTGDRRVLLGLVDQADILIQALRPGAFQKLGFDGETLRSTNPRLLYASVLAYGEEGPLSHLPGYDPLMQAQAGLMSVTGSFEGEPARVGTSIIDLTTGMWLAIALLAALREREQTGVGKDVSAALFDTALNWSGYHLLGYLADGTVPRPMGTELGMIAPYGALPASDGPVMVAAGNDALFGRLCHALKLGELPLESRFATNEDRVAHREELGSILAAATQGWERESLLAHLREQGVPAAPIQTMDQVAADPQTQASGMVLTPDSESGYPMMALPIRWGGARLGVAGNPPHHNADGAALRRENPGDAAPSESQLQKPTGD